jgi:hypothetical protein
MIPTSLLIRPASNLDDAVVRRLAALDSHAPLRGSVLLADVDGEPVAALSVDTGEQVADPFRPTAHIVEALRKYARSASPA